MSFTRGTSAGWTRCPSTCSAHSPPLKDWNIIPRLGEIRVPTLVTSGRYDEATPLIAGTVHDGIPGSQWVLFEESSHMPHAEEPVRYMQVLDEFLTGVESQAGENAIM